MHKSPPKWTFPAAVGVSSLFSLCCVLLSVVCLRSGSSSTPAHQMRNFVRPPQNLRQRSAHRYCCACLSLCIVRYGVQSFKDYAPDVFRAIRELSGLDPLDYLLCVCGNFKFLEFLSNSKSGQFFFYSHDRRYMIKTISDEECVLLREILWDYYEVCVGGSEFALARTRVNHSHLWCVGRTQ
jgi:hypothetical protein